MSFDIQQPVFSPEGEYLEDVAERYRDVLMERFEASPEGQDLVGRGGTIGWAETFMELGMGYLEVTPAEISAEQVQTILFELFPRKVSAEPGWWAGDRHRAAGLLEVLQREFGLPNADLCLRVLTTASARRLEREMQNPANFGLAKAFLALGSAQGFDMSTPQGMQAWAETYNAGLRVGTEQPLALPRVSTSRATRTAAASRRKLAQRSRRINRKKR